MIPVRAPRPPINKELAELWLFVMLALTLFSPATIFGWLAGVLFLRAFGLRRWWWLLVVAAAWVLYVGEVHRWDPEILGREHFRMYTEYLPMVLRKAQGTGAIFDAETIGALRRAMLGFAGLGFPFGLAVSVLSMYARRAAPPEWSASAIQEKAKARAASLRTAQMQAAYPPDDRMSTPGLGVSIDGDLPWLVTPRVLQHRLERGRRLQLRPPPMFVLHPDTLNYPRVLVGEPGFGKTTAFLRMVYTYALLGYQVVFVDGKGSDPDLPAQVISAFRMGRGGGNVGVYPDEPATIWRGSARNVVQKVLAVWEFDPRAEFFEAVAETGLALAIDVPGAPPVTSSRQLIERLDIAVLERLHAKHGTADSRSALKDLKASSKEWGFAGFAIRMRSLLRAVGTTLDGPWGFDDVDLAILTVPSGEKRKDASAIMRVMLEDFSQYATARKDPARPCLLIFDEFSALQGGRRTAMDLVERLRSTNTAVMLGVQSFEGLGVIHEARRLLNAASGGVMVFRTPAPEELVKLAGSITVPGLTHNLDHFGLTDRGMVRGEKKFRVDPDTVREYVPGEATYIWGGRAAHIFVCRTQIASWAVVDAEETIAEAKRAGERFLRQLQEQAQQEGNHAGDRPRRRPVATP